MLRGCTNNGSFVADMGDGHIPVAVPIWLSASICVHLRLRFFFSAKQNVSLDLMGFPAAIVIEGNEIHTRTGFLNVPSELLASLDIISNKELNIPVTHAKIMGWYDNEYGSYVNCLGKLTEYVASHIQ